MFETIFAKMETKGNFPLKPFNKFDVVEFKLLSVSIRTSFTATIRPQWDNLDYPLTNGLEKAEFIESINKQLRNKLGFINVHLIHKASLLKANIVKISNASTIEDFLLKIECVS